MAVETDNARCTCAELAERVDVFAARLFRTIGDDNRLVGLCLVRDVDLPAWLLAVLKAGGAYLPLDPALPSVRLRHILEDARPGVIAASRCLAPALDGADVPVLVAEDEADAPPAPAVTIRPDTLAYVIFTSGSTGHWKLDVVTGPMKLAMWSRVNRLTNSSEWVDPDDAPELGKDWFAKATVKKGGEVVAPDGRRRGPAQEPAVLRIDRHVQGRG